MSQGRAEPHGPASGNPAEADRDRKVEDLSQWLESVVPSYRRYAYGRAAWLFGRLLGLTFLAAFASFHVQFPGLIGEHGIQPAEQLLGALSARGYGFADVPTLAWFLGASDGAVRAMCILGEIAALGLFVGVLPGPSALLSTALYLSLTGVGGMFYRYQWDSLLVETGAVGALLLPWRLLERPDRMVEPPRLARWALWFLLFKLMFLSGYVKLASRDPTWADLTALEFHYWTQPLPNPWSWWAHQLPEAVHRVATFLVLALETALPFAILLGSSGRRVAAVGLGVLMALIGLTGNYGFFNLLALALIVLLVDDQAIERLLGRRLWVALRGRWEPAPSIPHGWGRGLRSGLAALLALFAMVPLLLRLGAGPALPDRVLTTFDAARPFRVANGYGLFAVMTTSRREIVIEGSPDGRTWTAYPFRYKPGDPSATPPWCDPHLPRLDWQMWFASLGTVRDNPWVVRLLRRLQEGRPEVLALFAADPFDGDPPRYVRARTVDYGFTGWREGLETGRTWATTPEPRPYAPALGPAEQGRGGAPAGGSRAVHALGATASPPPGTSGSSGARPPGARRPDGTRSPPRPAPRSPSTRPPSSSSPSGG